MKPIENVETKGKVAADLKELAKRVNEIIDAAPEGLRIRFSQNDMFGSKNSHVCVWVTEQIDY